MAFEPGHKHSAKAKLFDGALRRAIAQSDGERLRQAAEKLLDEAAAGKAWAIALLADRLDGKAPQSVEVTNIRRKASEYTVDELVAVAFGSGEGASEPEDGAGIASGVH